MDRYSELKVSFKGNILLLSDVLKIATIGDTIGELPIDIMLYFDIRDFVQKLHPLHVISISVYGDPINLTLFGKKL
jgi:hypothetical protein